MTTAEPPLTAGRRSPGQLLMAPRHWLQGQTWTRRSLTALSLLAVLLGSQTLAASTSQRPDVRLLLPSEGLLAGLGDGLRRGYHLAMDDSQRCGFRPPSLQLGWLPPGADPGEALRAAPRSSLLVAPPAAPLEAYGRIADQQRIAILLPLQRGQSLDGLPQQTGSDRLWPLVPGRSLEADRLAQALLAQGIRKAMVIRDRSAEGRSLSERFVASYAIGNGQVIGPSSEPLAIAAEEPGAIKQLEADVDWYRPAALVVISQPGSRLEHAVRQASWPTTVLLAWSFPVSQPMVQAQIGVDPLSRGPGWASFSQRFQRRWGYAPGLVESAGYDTGLMTALAAVSANGRSGWDLHGFSSNAKPQPLCTALKLRQEGSTVRPLAATSRLDLSPGVSPTASLGLSRP